MSEPAQITNGPHDWDMKTWIAAEPGQLTPRCSRCGASAASDGTDGFCECDQDGEGLPTWFDGSDHEPDCEYWTNTGCPDNPLTTADRPSQKEN